MNLVSFHDMVFYYEFLNVAEGLKKVANYCIQEEACLAEFVYSSSVLRKIVPTAKKRKNFSECANVLIKKCTSVLFCRYYHYGIIIFNLTL